MKKHTARENDDDLRPEYDLSQLKGRVQGKYYKRAMSGTNLVLVEPDSAEACPGDEPVDQDLLAALIKPAELLKPSEWLQFATREAGPLLADPYVETRSAKGEGS
jgi:hypothetical protein